MITHPPGVNFDINAVNDLRWTMADSSSASIVEATNTADGSATLASRYCCRSGSGNSQLKMHCRRWLALLKLGM